jgi:hypothetical protein
LECQASGTPLPQVIWTKNGTQIQPNEYFFIESSTDGVHRLIIKNAQLTHSGVYSANVKQKVRTQYMNFNVIITGMFKYRSVSFLNIYRHR